MLPGLSARLVHTVRLLASGDLGVFLTGLGPCSPPAKEFRETERDPFPKERKAEADTKLARHRKWLRWGCVGQTVSCLD